jgi:hypothetical protein
MGAVKEITGYHGGTSLLESIKLATRYPGSNNIDY